MAQLTALMSIYSICDSRKQDFKYDLDFKSENTW